MKISGNAVFHLFYYTNTTYSSRRATKIGMHMFWDAFSVRQKTMKIETFLGTQNMKKTVFLRTSKFIFTFLRPYS